MSQACLYVVATPIGNLSDLSPRVRETLATASLVAAEDTRRSRHLLTHLDLHKPLLRCDERNETRATEAILDRLGRNESVAIVTDAGVPTISDPGGRLVGHVHEAGFPVVPIPGPSAVTTALSVAGFLATPYCFLGFLPRKGKHRKRILSWLDQPEMTFVLFESPYRLVRTLGDLAERYPGRRGCVARELTKIHEEVARGPLSELAQRFGAKTVKGECTIVVAPGEPA